MQTSNLASTALLRKTEFTPYALTVFGVAVLYYAFAYLLRVYPGVMEGELSAYFGMSAGSFGVLTSFYYFGYAPMQLPVGISVDRIGPRRSLMMACVISTSGAFLFSSTDSYSLALLGRFMIGVGSAFAYVTALKLATIWLPKTFFGTAAGILTGLGMFSAILTDIGLTRLIQTAGFKSTLVLPTYFGLTVLALIFLIVRDEPNHQTELEREEEATVSFSELRIYLKQIVRSKQMWLIGLVGSLMYLPSSMFLDVWAIPYLKRAHGLTAEDAAFGASIMFSGWIVSTMTTGMISDIFRNRKMPILVATFVAIIVSCILLYVPIKNHTLIYTLLFFFGMSCGPHPLCFTLSKELFPKEIAGTAIAFANCCIMFGGLVFQPLVGKLLDLQWQGNYFEGVRIYTADNYMMALSVMPIGLVISFFLSLAIREGGQIEGN